MFHIRRTPRGDHRPRATSLTVTLAGLTSVLAMLCSPAWSGAASAAAPAAASGGVSVDLGTLQGKPTYHASGTLYGMTPDGSGPPAQYYTDLKWRLERAGGAQLNSGGYATSLADYQTRWASTLAQYKRTRALGGTFVLLPHDLWGADGTTSQAFPGDNGDWTQFDSFLDQLVSDVQANHMTVEWDLWNEPDGAGFWKPSQTQYLQMWSRFYAKVRTAFPGQLIVGPSTAGQPTSSWWATYLTYIKTNNAAPDIYSWHDEPGDPVTGATAADTALTAHGLTNTRPYQINEYATAAQQTSGGGAWFIARLERAGADGIRGNWASGTGLHDNEAALLTKVNGQYQPLAEWWVYRAYAQMSGHIATTTPGTNLDAYATVTNDKKEAQILVGDNQSGTPSPVTVNVSGSKKTKLADRQGRIRVVVQRFADGGGRPTGGAITVSDTLQKADASGNLSLGIDYKNASDAYLVTLLRPGTATAFDGNITISGDLPAAGAASTVVTTFRNSSQDALEALPTQQLNAPSGWNVHATTPTTALLLAPGATSSTRWTVTAPADAAGSSALLTATAHWREAGAPKGTFQATSWQLGTVSCSLGQTCELEQGTLSGGACVATDHPGYTGTGFVACYDSGFGRGATQQVFAPAAGSYTATLRYSAGPNGPATDRTITVTVNGGTPQVITLPRTGSWNTWADAATTLQLNAGVNVITYSNPSTTTGWVNLDHLIVSPSSP